MSDNFNTFSKPVAAAFQKITAGPCYVVDISGDALYEKYLASFPEGTNKLWKKKTEFDCSCCKHFVRRAGNVVSIDASGHLATVWDEAAEGAPEPYRTVAKALQAMVESASIVDLYRVGAGETSFGSPLTRVMDPESKQVRQWNHFHTGDIPKTLRDPKADTTRGDYRTTVQVFERGLLELLPSAIETVLGLIDANALYRGAEHRAAIVAFQKAQREYSALTPKACATYCWTHATGPASRFRNTVIGTLVQDLSEGKDLEQAVKSFETKVAPQNYKRTTALITPGMVKKAMETIDALGLEDALERRFAVIGDITVNDVKWVDGAAKAKMKGGIGDVLMKVAKKTAQETGDPEHAEDITLDAFMAKLPEVTGLEILFKGQHQGNLMSLTAPIHPEPKQLFRWSNDFAWSYKDGVADSLLRKQVQSLGGRVDGVLRFSHMWNHVGRNASLMDLHVFMPGCRHEDGCHDVYPMGARVGWNRRADGPSGGVQDVDYTAAAPEGYVPVENITFPTKDRLREGQYTFKIHNWALRQPTTSGFRAEIEFGGQIYQYEHPQPLKQKEWITLAVATLKDGVFTIEHKHPVGTASQEVWGLSTEKYAKVTAVTLSPNFWGSNAVGNKHTFFVLDGCRNDEATRGFYNEFLHPRLEEHRKVFEVIGDKTKCQPTEGQLSGLGFSSTKKESFIVRATSGKKQRVYNVHVT